MSVSLRPGIDHIGVNIVFFCHDGKGRYVFNRRGKNTRDEQGMWDCGAGKLEWGETVEACLRKEVKEEYCADVLAFEFLGYGDIHREHHGQKTHWIGLRFRVLVDPVQVKNGEPHKFDAIAWHTPADLPRPLHSQVAHEFHEYRERLV